jgi:hypothetical protein
MRIRTKQRGIAVPVEQQPRQPQALVMHLDQHSLQQLQTA